MATIAWHDGRLSTATVAATDPHADLAVIRVVAPDDAVVVPVAGEGGWPEQGARVELCGYGGSENRLRHWTAKVDGYALTMGTGKHQTLQVDTQTIGGDSGGPILYAGRVVGVIWGGPNCSPGGRVYPLRGTCCVRIREFLQRVCPRSLEPCPRRKQPAHPTPQPPPAESVEPPAELTAIRQELAELRVALARFEQAHDCPGKPGPPGPPGRPGRDAEITDADVDRVIDAVERRIKGSMRIRIEPVLQTRSLQPSMR